MRQWAIVIGLNEYQSFQPLSCAQRDAEALHQFLIHEAGLPAEQCLLLTNSSPDLWGKPTLPTRVNVQSWIELLAQNCIQPGDSLWFFFSGHGLCDRGEDYLVPIDGLPDAVATTCLSLRSIYARLASYLAAGTSVLLLDINRNQSALFHESVGVNVAQLAHQFALPTILSCQPGQFSREISGLGHGLFTATLIEGLRYQQGATLATLIHFLRDRLPELSEHYWQPIQQPLAVCPATKLHQPLLPTTLGATQNGMNGYAAIAVNPASTTAVLSTPALPLLATGSVAAPLPGLASPVSAPRPHNGVGLSQEINTPMAAASPTWEHHRTPPQTNGHLDPGETASQPAPDQTPGPQSSDEKIWQPMLFWGSLVSLVLMGCVLWRNWSLLGTPVATIAQSAPVTNPAPGQTSNNAAAIANSSGQRSTSTAAPNPDTLQQTPTSLGLNGSASVPAPAPSQAANPPSGSILNFNPATPTQNPSGQAILANAREMVKLDQATPYRDAIDEARKIASEDGVYQAAQQNIADWSQTIYAIAQRRASQKQWDMAILAADLVPSDDKKMHPQAQAAIAQWCPILATLPATTAGLLPAKAICNAKKLV